MTGGVLRWGVRESFVEYIGALDDGVIEWESPAEPGRFPLREVRGKRLSFAGGVLFSGHAGLLLVRLREPIVDLDAGTLSFIDAREPKPLVVLELGELSLVATPDGWKGIAASPLLAADGVHLFGGTYRRGEPFDPIEIELKGPPPDR